MFHCNCGGEFNTLSDYKQHVIETDHEPRPGWADSRYCTCGKEKVKNDGIYHCKECTKKAIQFDQIFR